MAYQLGNGYIVEITEYSGDRRTYKIKWNTEMVDQTNHPTSTSANDILKHAANVIRQHREIVEMCVKAAGGSSPMTGTGGTAVFE